MRTGLHIPEGSTKKSQTERDLVFFFASGSRQLWSQPQNGQENGEDTVKKCGNQLRHLTVPTVKCLQGASVNS